MTLTWYDFVVIGILIFTTFRGAQRGLVWQLAWIAALVLCFGFAETLSLQLAPTIRGIFPQATPPLDRWISMLILYMGFSFLSFGVARVLRGWIEKAKFVEYDRHLGGIFGFVKGVIVCLVMTFFVITLSESTRGTVLASKSGYAAAVIMNKLEPVMPQELARILEPYIIQLDPGHTHEDELSGEDDSPFADDHLFGSGSGSVDGTRESEAGKSKSLWDLLGGDRGAEPPAAEGPDVAGSPRGEDMGLREFIRRLPETMSLELQQSAVDAYRNATPQQREVLMKQVADSLPGELSDVLRQFNALRDRWNNAAPPPAADDKVAGTEQSLAAISRIFSDRQDEQDRFREQVTQRLAGVPVQVAAAALLDWQADLTAATDPDPQTDYRTKLDVRIYRQLTAARVPIERLSQGLQQRMRNVARQ